MGKEEKMRRILSARVSISFPARFVSPLAGKNCNISRMEM